MSSYDIDRNHAQSTLGEHGGMGIQASVWVTIFDAPRGDQYEIVIEDDVWIRHGAVVLLGMTSAGVRCDRCRRGSGDGDARRVAVCHCWHQACGADRLVVGKDEIARQEQLLAEAAAKGGSRRCK